MLLPVKFSYGTMRHRLPVCAWIKCILCPTLVFSCAALLFLPIAIIRALQARHSLRSLSVPASGSAEFWPPYWLLASDCRPPYAMPLGPHSLTPVLCLAWPCSCAFSHTPHLVALILACIICSLPSHKSAISHSCHPLFLTSFQHGGILLYIFFYLTAM